MSHIQYNAILFPVRHPISWLWATTSPEYEPPHLFRRATTSPKYENPNILNVRRYLSLNMSHHISWIWATPSPEYEPPQLLNMSHHISSEELPHLLNMSHHISYPDSPHLILIFLFTDGAGIGRLVEATGAPSIINSCFSLVRKGAKLVLIGKYTVKNGIAFVNLIFNWKRALKISSKGWFHSSVIWTKMLQTVFKLGRFIIHKFCTTFWGFFLYLHLLLVAQKSSSNILQKNP